MLFRRVLLVVAGVVATLAIAGSAVASPLTAPPPFTAESADGSMQVAAAPRCPANTVCVWPVADYIGGRLDLGVARFYDCKWVETAQMNRSVYNNTKFAFSLWKKTQFNRIYVGTAAPFKAYANVPYFDIIQSPGCPYP